MNADKSLGRPRVLAWVTNPVCAPYRVYGPLGLLAQRGEIELDATNEFGERQFKQLVGWATHFVIQRARLSPNLAQVIAAGRQRGVRILYEIDDELLCLHGVPELAEMVSTNYCDSIRSAMESADVVWTSTPRLVEVFSKYRRAILLPNHLPFEPPPFRPKSKRAIRRVVYGGGAWHQPDWNYVVGELHRKLAKEAASGGTIDVILIGATWTPPVDSSKLSYHVLPSLPFHQYLAQLGVADVSIAPLKPNEHTVAKSDIKFLEAAAMSTPTVAMGEPYIESLNTHGRGMFAKTPDEFSQLVVDLLRDRERGETIARAAHHYVSSERRLDTHAQQWFAALET